MRITQARRSSRVGFTLIELLVVIAIIAILVGLVSVAVIKFLVKGPQTATRSEIGQLETSLALFRDRFGLSEQLPSRLVLCERYIDYFVGGIPANGAKSTIHQESLGFLQRAFPKLWRTSFNQDPNKPGGWIDWNNNGTKDGEVVLEGDQCLVFFLGGIPTPPGQTFGCLGFGSLGSNPSTLTPGKMKGPYFEFKSSQLVQIHGSDSSADRFFSCQDYYKKSASNVYAYFSSYRSVNGYNRYFGTKDANGNAITTSDCATLGVWPYAEFVGNQSSGPRYLSPNSVQIISAGMDGMFGVGTDFSSKNPRAWTPANALNIDPNGADDQANFHQKLLGFTD